MIWPEPIGENQKSIDDNWGCASYATTHAVESQIKVQTGKTVDLSARFLAIMSGTTPGVGNYASKVFETAFKYGIPDAADCPEPAGQWTNAEYYGFPITQALLDKAKKFKDEWEMDYKTNDVTLADLKVAPLLAWVPQYTPNHFVEVLDEKTRFDTYQPFRRPLGSVQKFFQFIIERKVESMNLVNDNGTYYLEGEKGKIGIADLPFLNALKTITDKEEKRPSAGVQTKVVESAQSFLIKDK